MASLAETAIRKVIEREGGFGNDRRDAGNWTGGQVGAGELKGTKYGISAAQYPDLDIENLSINEAIAIYRRDYWDKCQCDDLPPALAAFMFDAAVQHGAGQASHDAPAMLQRALGINADGIIGPQTLTAARNAEPQKALGNLFVERILHYSNLSTWPVYRKGWMKRLSVMLIFAAGFVG